MDPENKFSDDAVKIICNSAIADATLNKRVHPAMKLKLNQ